MQDYSKQAMIDFIDYVGAKHLVKPSAAKNWKTVAGQFLSLLDENESQDLRNLDLEHLSERYAHSKGNSVKLDSIRLYASRFKSAHENFIEYARDKLNYRPSTTTRKSKTSSGLSPTKKKESTRQVEKIKQIQDVSISESSHGGVDFPIPISQGRIVFLKNLPYELTSLDAEKIANVVRALAMPNEEN